MRPHSFAALLAGLVLVAIVGVGAPYLHNGTGHTVSAAGHKATATPTGTRTPSATSTATCKPPGKCAKSPTVTATPTNTSTNTPIPSPTDTSTPTNTATYTPTPTDTATDTPTPTDTATDTPTPTDTVTESPTPTDTATESPTPTETIDQAQTDASTAFGGISLPGGETFTPAAANISSFDIWFWCSISANMVVEEWSSGTVIAGPFVVTETSGGSSPTHVEIPGGPVSLAPGTKYGIIVTSLNSGGTSPSPSICLKATSGNPYLGGSLVSGGFELQPPGFAAEAYFVTYAR